MIRRATIDDTERLVEMGGRFVASTTYQQHVKADPGRIAEMVLGLLDNAAAAVLVSGSDATVTGMIALLAYEHPYSGELTAFELVWWVEPEARGDGVRLLRAAEDWARELGATKMQMVAPEERVGKLYERLGYSAVETSYQRSL